MGLSQRLLRRIKCRSRLPWISSALLPAFSRKLISTEGLRNISIKCLDQSKTSFSRKQSAAMDDAGLCASPVFSRECIFCENLEIKAYGKTESPVKFASWKHKESAWQQIEPQALELGNTRLHCQIIGKDLHAVEAQCHPYCRAKFRREYQSHFSRGYL